MLKIVTTSGNQSGPLSTRSFHLPLESYLIHGDDEDDFIKSLAISENVYDLLMQARLLSTRGSGNSIEDVDLSVLMPELRKEGIKTSMV